MKTKTMQRTMTEGPNRRNAIIVASIYSQQMRDPNAPQGKIDHFTWKLKEIRAEWNITDAEMKGG